MLKETITAYKALSDIQKQFIKTRRVNDLKTPDDWLVLLGKLGEYDRYGDMLRRFLGKIAIAGFILTMVTFFVFISMSVGALFIGGICLLLLICSIFAAFSYFILKSKDIPNSLRQVVIPLISILRVEIDGAQKINLKLDLRGAKLNRKMIGSEKKGGKGFFGDYPKIVETNYKDQWLEISAPLADKNKLNCQVTDFVCHRKITKRGRSGKIKTKFKDKTKTLIDVQLGLDGDKYIANEEIDKSKQSVTVKTGPKRQVVRAKQTVKTIGEINNLKPAHILDTISRAYMKVNSKSIQGGS